MFSSSDMDDTASVVFGAFLFGVVILLLIGGCIGGCVGRVTDQSVDAIKIEAVERGYGEWTANKEFRWKEPKGE